MSFEDFSKQFTHLDLVHIGPDDWMNEPALHSKKPWRAVLARRRWRAGYNAGGGPHHLGMSYWWKGDSMIIYSRRMAGEGAASLGLYRI
jgi:hypothetical protein